MIDHLEAAGGIAGSWENGRARHWVCLQLLMEDAGVDEGMG